jgi:hypothetical protein
MGRKKGEKKASKKPKKVFPCGGTIPGLERTDDWRRPNHEKLIYYRCTTEEVVASFVKASYTTRRSICWLSSAHSSWNLVAAT